MLRRSRQTGRPHKGRQAAEAATCLPPAATCLPPGTVGVPRGRFFLLLFQNLVKPQLQLSLGQSFLAMLMKITKQGILQTSLAFKADIQPHTWEAPTVEEPDRRRPSAKKVSPVANPFFGQRKSNPAKAAPRKKNLTNFKRLQASLLAPTSQPCFRRVTVMQE